jgi:hypothetical protein
MQLHIQNTPSARRSLLSMSFTPSSDKAALSTVLVVKLSKLHGSSSMSLTNFFLGSLGWKIGVLWVWVLLLGVQLYHKDMGFTALVDSLINPPSNIIADLDVSCFI